MKIKTDKNEYDVPDWLVKAKELDTFNPNILTEEAETEKAILVTDQDKTAWLPKSQLTVLK